MSEAPRFRGPAGVTLVPLPFDLDAIAAGWAGLRPQMARHLPPAFQRDEWAYLISFLDERALHDVFRATFGERDDGAGPVARLARPGGPVAVWLPNNVSLLGPLIVVLCSLTGNELLLKGGTRGEDLTGPFLDFAREHLGPGALASHLERRVRYRVFGRDDPANAEHAARARVRIVFGTDEAAAAVEALPHPLGSVSFPFTDRRSEAWLEPRAADDGVLDTLLKVFAIYGQAGCTSPRRVVLLGAEEAEARALRDRLLARWPGVVRGRPAPHVASSSILGRQWAAALGWSAELAPEHAAVLATGTAGLEEFEAPMGLPIVAATAEEAVRTAPANLQTIGHALRDSGAPRWRALVEAAGAKRFVPLARMHHFGPVWDGMAFWRGCFEELEVEA